MAYTLIGFEDKPSTKEKVNANNLNHMDNGIYNNDQNKVDKEVGKGLSTNDFTDTYKSQVDTNTTNIDTNTTSISYKSC